MVVDPDGKITHASRAAEQLAGHPVLQHSFNDVFKVSHESGEALSIDKICSLTNQKGILKNVDVTALLINGRKVDALLSSAILMGSNAALLGCVIHLTDITDRKRASLEIKRHAAELARANEDLVHFAYAVSHDLHAPLRNITSFSQILMRQYKPKLDDKGEKMIDSIVQAALRMDGMLHDLLQFVTIAGSEVQIDQAVPLDEILTDALTNLGAAIEECAATITHEPLPAAHIDGSQFVQLFQNLIGNALKYRKPGVPPQVHISAQPQREEWVVAVRDNGIGFDNKDRDKIFGVFQRLNNSEHSGTGIGLTICKRIVERHGGRIWADSQPGEGSVFSFSVPCPKIAPDPSPCISRS